MITGNIKDAEKYYSVNPHFKEVFEFLKTIDEQPMGNFNFENFNGGKSEPETSDLDKDGNERVLEAHRDYLDIHYVIKGAEGFGYSRCDILEAVTEYNKEQDYVLLKGEKNKIILHEGDFCIVFPEDAHTPCMSGGDDSKLQKTVIKIKLS